MAKDVTGPIWTFDAVDQYEGIGNEGEATAPVHLTKPFIDWITIESGASGGTYDVRETNGGKHVTGTLVLSANSQVQLIVGKHLSGVYIETFGDGQILVSHGDGA